MYASAADVGAFTRGVAVAKLGATSSISETTARTRQASPRWCRSHSHIQHHRQRWSQSAGSTGLRWLGRPRRNGLPRHELGDECLTPRDVQAAHTPRTNDSTVHGD
jgi:hypothetical protein